MRDLSEFVRVREIGSREQAELARIKLEAEGVLALLVHADGDGWFRGAGPTPMWGRSSVFVHRKDLARALQVLRTMGMAE